MSPRFKSDCPGAFSKTAVGQHKTYHHATDPQCLGRVHLAKVAESLCPPATSEAFLILPLTVLDQAPTNWNIQRSWTHSECLMWHKCCSLGNNWLRHRIIKCSEPPIKGTIWCTYRWLPTLTLLLRRDLLCSRCSQNSIWAKEEAWWASVWVTDLAWLLPAESYCDQLTHTKEQGGLLSGI